MASGCCNSRGATFMEKVTPTFPSDLDPRYKVDSGVNREDSASSPSGLRITGDIPPPMRLCTRPLIQTYTYSENDRPKIFFLPKRRSILHATTQHIEPAIDRARRGSSSRLGVQRARVIEGRGRGRRCRRGEVRIVAPVGRSTWESWPSRVPPAGQSLGVGERDAIGEPGERVPVGFPRAVGARVEG